MAPKIQTLDIDDLDGTGAEGTVASGRTAPGMRPPDRRACPGAATGAGARYVPAGRRAGGGTRRPARSRGGARASGLNTTEVRGWANARGIDGKDRGRVPAGLVIKFTAATGK